MSNGLCMSTPDGVLAGAIRGAFALDAESNAYLESEVPWGLHLTARLPKVVETQ